MNIIQKLRRHINRARVRRARKKLIWDKIDYFNLSSTWRARILLRTDEERFKEHFNASTDIVLASSIPPSIFTSILFSSYESDNLSLGVKIAYVFGALSIFGGILAVSGARVARRMAIEYCINKEISTGQEFKNHSIDHKRYNQYLFRRALFWDWLSFWSMFFGLMSFFMALLIFISPIIGLI